MKKPGGVLLDTGSRDPDESIAACVTSSCNEDCGKNGDSLGGARIWQRVVPDWPRHGGVVHRSGLASNTAVDRELLVVRGGKCCGCALQRLGLREGGKANRSDGPAFSGARRNHCRALVLRRLGVVGVVEGTCAAPAVEPL